MKHIYTIQYKSRAFFAMLIFLASLFFASIHANAEQVPSLISDESDGVSINYEVNEGFAWCYSTDYSSPGYDAYIAGNSFTDEENISNFAVVVTNTGILSFDYKISTAEGDAYALYYNLNKPIDAINYTSACNYSLHTSFSGVTDWSDVEITIEEEDLNEGGQTTVYIAYLRNGIDVENENVAIVANVCFIADEELVVGEDEKIGGFIDVYTDIGVPKNDSPTEPTMIFKGFGMLQTGGGNPDYPLVSGDSADVIVDYEVNDDLGWYHSEDYSTPGYDAYLAGNSFSNQADVSNISLTITGTGFFSFDYKVSTPSSGRSYALYYDVNKPIGQGEEGRQSAMNFSDYKDFRGNVDWTNVGFNITSADLIDGEATIYIAYHRDGTSTNNENMVAIANVCFVSGSKKLILHIDGKEHGSVTGIDGNIYADGQNTLNYESGDTVTLTAVAQAEGCFLGWLSENGELITTSENYSFTISNNTTLKAVFGPKDSIVARRNSQFYTAADGGLAQALTDAASGDIIVMLGNQTLAVDAVIPRNVKVYIPYSADFDPDGNADGVTTADSLYQASVKIAGADKTYRTLIINSGVTLTVNGTLNVGSVISYPGQNYQGHTSGWHGKIENDGHIIVNSGGVIDSWGLITGAGTVSAESGSSVFEPFIVYDFAGGMNSYYLYSDGYPQSPFKQYAIQNIQNQLVLNSGSMYYVHCNLYADGGYNKTDIRFIGSEALYQPASGATVIRTYDGTKCISTDTDIGKVTYTFNGGMICTSMSIIVLNVAISTEKVEFPIPYNWDMVLENGDYWFEGKVKLMPGATLVVKDDAILRVQDRFFVLDGLIQSDMSGKIYPSTDTLQSAGFSGSGQLFVNGTMIVADGATFGGIVQTQTSSENPVATVTVEKGAIVNKTGVQDGAVGGYDVNTSIFDLSARMYIYDGTVGDYTLEGLVAERTYSSYAATPWSIDGYIMKYAVDCAEAERSPDIPERSSKFHKWVTTEVTLDEERSGSWVMNDLYYTVRVINKTAYNSADSSNVTIIADGLEDDRAYTAAGDEFSFTITATEAGKGYVSLITRTTSSGEPAMLTADAAGNYVIDRVNDDVTITVISCKLGDPNLDGMIDAFDLLEIRKIIVGYVSPTPLQRLAANTDRDLLERIDALDLLQIRKYIVDYIKEF